MTLAQEAASFLGYAASKNGPARTHAETRLAAPISRLSAVVISPAGISEEVACRGD